MGQAAAKYGDKIVNKPGMMDWHFVIGGAGPVLTPFVFSGLIEQGVSSNVRIMGRPAAVVGCTAKNIPPHIPESGTFEFPPANEGKIIAGSTTVRINGKMAARQGDTALTCNDPEPLPVGQVQVLGVSTVMIGGE